MRHYSRPKKKAGFFKRATAGMLLTFIVAVVGCAFPPLWIILPACPFAGWLVVD